MAGFLGAGNYGVARMNGGFSARPCLPSARSPDRGAPLRLVQCLLPARHPEEPGPAARPRPDPHAILETFATLQMVDVHLPTTDGRQLVLPRHTRPNREHALLLHQLNLQLPTQPAPRLTTLIPRLRAASCSADLWGTIQ